MKKEDDESLILNVQCKKCKKCFDFASYLNENDIGKNIAQLVLEKCYGNDILCKNCLAKSKKILVRLPNSQYINLKFR